MFIDYVGISDEAKKIKARLRARKKQITVQNLYELLSIELVSIDTEYDPDEYKASYHYICRIHLVQYNSKLEEKDEKPVLFHEAGHRVLHWRDAKNGTIYSDGNIEKHDVSLKEAEANVFTAEMLMDDDPVLNYIYNRHMTFEDTANCLGVSQQMLAYKCTILQKRGYKNIKIPVSIIPRCMKG